MKNRIGMQYWAEKKEIQDSYCILNDTSFKKSECMEKIEKELKDKEAKKDFLNKQLYSLNKINGTYVQFKNICEKFFW